MADGGDDGSARRRWPGHRSLLKAPGLRATLRRELGQSRRKTCIGETGAFNQAMADSISPRLVALDGDGVEQDIEAEWRRLTILRKSRITAPWAR